MVMCHAGSNYDTKRRRSCRCRKLAQTNVDSFVSRQDTDVFGASRFHDAPEEGLRLIVVKLKAHACTISSGYAASERHIEA